MVVFKTMAEDQEWEKLVPFHQRYDPILGTETAEPLFQACWGWICSQHYLDRESLKQILADTNFQKILEVQTDERAWVS